MLQFVTGSKICFSSYFSFLLLATHQVHQVQVQGGLLDTQGGQHRGGGDGDQLGDEEGEHHVARARGTPLLWPSWGTDRYPANSGTGGHLA